jgi:monoamine oxidase
MGAADAREPTKEEYHSVVVVGAGVAGLQAARQLLPSFPDILVIEASHRIGGRIKQVIGAPLFQGHLWSRDRGQACALSVLDCVPRRDVISCGKSLPLVCMPMRRVLPCNLRAVWYQKRALPHE